MIKLVEIYHICGSARLVYKVSGKKYSYIFHSHIRGKEIKTKWGFVKINKYIDIITIGLNGECKIETKRIVQSALSIIYNTLRGLSPQEDFQESNDKRKEERDSQRNEPSGFTELNTAERESSLPSREGDDNVEKDSGSECPRDGNCPENGASVEETDISDADTHFTESESCPAAESGLDDETADYGVFFPSEKEGEGCGDRAQTGEVHSDQSGVDTSKVLKALNNYLEDFGGVAKGQSDEKIVPFVKKLFDIPKSCGGGGGGSMLDIEDRTCKINQKIREGLSRLASGEDVSQKEEGYDFWDSKKVAISITTSPHKIDEAKYKRPPDKVYFFVDTSGSVREYGDFIIRMIKSSCSDKVKVMSGSEAHPEVDENLRKKMFDYVKEFSEQMSIFIKTYKPEIGSTFVFWGDLHDVNIAPENTKKLLRNYRCIWLHSCGDECRYRGCERENAIKSGFKLMRGIKDDISFVKALKSI